MSSGVVSPRVLPPGSCMAPRARLPGQVRIQNTSQTALGDATVASKPMGKRKREGTVVRVRCLAHGAPSPPFAPLQRLGAARESASLSRRCPLRRIKVRAVGDSHTVGKLEVLSSCSVVLLCPHPWLSLASPLPSSLRCGTIGLSCHVPTALRTDGPFPRTTVQRHKGAERGELRPCLRLVGCLFAGAQRCVHTTRGRGWWSTSRRQR